MNCEEKNLVELILPNALIFTRQYCTKFGPNIDFVAYICHAELEAKLENNNEERRALLERCLASEGELEKLREKNSEMRRKLDDTQAALHELGRENQSLQVSIVLSTYGLEVSFVLTTKSHVCV